MEAKKVLFITYDLSGYYDSVHTELQRRYEHVDYYNTAKVSFSYNSLKKKLHNLIYKIFKGTQLKSFYRYEEMMRQIGNTPYDITIIIRPDVFHDIHLEALRKISKKFIAYYHDSINNIRRKKDVIRYFDTIFSYEKKDVRDYGFEFISNFIYFDGYRENGPLKESIFCVMSDDYRVSTLERLARFMKKQKRDFKFFVKCKHKKEGMLITCMHNRMSSQETNVHLKEAGYFADIHKYKCQHGLTFRVFEALGYRKKIITTNRDIRNYDFYNPNNIFIIEDVENIDIPQSFFETPYEEIPVEIYNHYTVKEWVDRLLKDI